MAEVGREETCEQMYGELRPEQWLSTARFIGRDVSEIMAMTGRELFRAVHAEVTRRERARIGRYHSVPDAPKTRPGAY